MQLLRTSLFAAGAAIALSATAAQAQLTFYGDDTNGSATTRATNVGTAAARNAFLAFLTGAVTEEFEPPTINPGDTPPILLDFGSAGTATLNSGGASGRVVFDGGDGVSTNGNGRYANTNPGYYETRSTANDLTTFRIDFSQQVASFGFVGIDIGDYNSQLTLVFQRGDGMGGYANVFEYVLPYAPSDGDNSLRDGSRLFAGYIAQNDAQRFDRVLFRGTDRDDVFAFDDMTVGAQVVPEPATVGLLATGVAALGLVGYRRRRDQA